MTTKAKHFHPIAVGAFWTNVLDLVGREDLVTREGDPVTLRRVNMDRDFEITCNGKVYRAGGNMTASAILNNLEIGTLE